MLSIEFWHATRKNLRTYSLPSSRDCAQLLLLHHREQPRTHEKKSDKYLLWVELVYANRYKWSRIRGHKRWYMVIPQVNKSKGRKKWKILTSSWKKMREPKTKHIHWKYAQISAVVDVLLVAIMIVTIMCAIAQRIHKSHIWRLTKLITCLWTGREFRTWRNITLPFCHTGSMSRPSKSWKTKRLEVNGNKKSQSKENDGKQHKIPQMKVRSDIRSGGCHPYQYPKSCFCDDFGDNCLCTYG